LLLAVSIAFAWIAALAALAPAVILWAIATVFYYRTAAGGLTVMQIVFAAIAAAIVRLTFQLWARLLAGDAVILASASLRALLAEKIGTLPIGTLAVAGASTFAARLLDDVEAIGGYLSGEFVDLVLGVAIVAWASLLLAWRDWPAALALAGFVAAGWIVASLFRPRVSAERESSARDAFAASALEALRGSISSKTLPPVEPGTDPVAAYAASYRLAQEPRARDTATIESAWRAYAGAIPALVLVAALLAGGSRDIPTLVLVAAIGLRAGGAMIATFVCARAAVPAFDGLRRIDATLSTPSAAGGTQAPPRETSVRFRSVEFAYPGRAEAVLRDVDFVADAGRVTAIVGPSGSGKTTLMRLAAGFWQPVGGAVEVGGRDARELDADALMREIAYVFQDVYLLNDTIAANIRIGDPDADDAAIERVARAAGAHDFISRLPEGYATVVGDRGQTLSRGERQRIQIARALLKDAPIVLLDEPTASLDPATEAHVQDALTGLLRGKTVIAVTHRLGTIVDVDRIVVLDRTGRVEAAGTHTQLLHASPTYARLWSDYVEAIDWIDQGERVG
jgi:ATP-binding cassette subfamily B protein